MDVPDEGVMEELQRQSLEMRELGWSLCKAEGKLEVLTFFQGPPEIR